MRECKVIRHDDKAACRLAPKCDGGRFNFQVATNGRNDSLNFE
jgi:hypothetical protein